MRVELACVDQDTIWIVDEIIYGLYSIEKKTFKTKCVINSWELFRYGYFKPQALIEWKDIYIIIIPLNIQKKWIIYNKITDKLEYRQILSIKCECTFICIDKTTNEAYFCPVSLQDPIVVIDFEKLICTRVITGWASGISKNDNIAAWRGTHNKKYIFFPLRGVEIFVRLTHNDKKIKILKSDIMEGISDMDCYLEEIWVLPTNGKRIYRINENGKILFSIELIVKEQEISTSEFVKIIVQKNFVFLLPYHFCGIFVYDKLKHQLTRIAENNLVLSETYRTRNIRYWGYYIENNYICFLPLQNKFLQIDLNTLTCEQKDIFYPEKWQEKKRMFQCIWNHVSENNGYLMEKDQYSQSLFLSYIQDKNNKRKSKWNIDLGKKIWKNI